MSAENIKRQKIKETTPKIDSCIDPEKDKTVMIRISGFNNFAFGPQTTGLSQNDLLVSG